MGKEMSLFIFKYSDIYPEYHIVYQIPLYILVTYYDYRNRLNNQLKQP